MKSVPLPKLFVNKVTLPGLVAYLTMFSFSYAVASSVRYLGFKDDLICSNLSELKKFISFFLFSKKTNTGLPISVLS